MDNKKVAKHALHFIGGKPSVARYYNSDESKQIDIMTSDSGIIKGIPVCATIGLNRTDIGLSIDGKKLRVELISACNLNSEAAGNILATIAFDIMDSKACGYGMVLPNVIGSYTRDTSLKHALLMSPVFWPEYKTLADNDCTVAWLMVFPITDSEKRYIEQNGFSAFDHLLEQTNTDVTNMHRKCVL